MKWMVFLPMLLLVSCTFSFNDPDEVAYRQVVVPAAPKKVNMFDDAPTVDVTHTVIRDSHYSLE